MSYKDPEKCRARVAAWQATHREYFRAYGAAYRAAHPKQIRVRKAAYRAAHREERRAYNAARPEVQREANRKHKALKRQTRQIVPERMLTREQWHKILGLAKGRCFYCKRKRKLTQDHVTPLNKGGLHVAENVVAACRSCNSRKQAKIVMLF